MAGGFFLMGLLVATATVTAQRIAEEVKSTPTPDETLKKTILEKLLKIEDALAESQKCPSSEGLDAVVAQLAVDLQNTKSQLQTTQTELQTTRTELQTTKTELGALKDLKSDQGSTFVRWGRKSCPPKTTLVYSGIAAGKHYSHTASGSNRLCLTSSPQFDNTRVPHAYGTLFGGEYERIPGHHNNEAPCSVCRAAQSTTIMIAGTLTCPAGWTSQYTGHLASERERPGHYASEYVCLDGNPEDALAVDGNDNGSQFAYVRAVCGSIPCPPYANNKVVTCAVCSK